MLLTDYHGVPEGLGDHCYRYALVEEGDCVTMTEIVEPETTYSLQASGVMLTPECGSVFFRQRPPLLQIPLTPRYYPRLSYCQRLRISEHHILVQLLIHHDFTSPEIRLFQCEYLTHTETCVDCYSAQSAELGVGEAQFLELGDGDVGDSLALWFNLTQPEPPIEVIEERIESVHGTALLVGGGFVFEIDCGLQLLAGRGQETQLPNSI